MSTSNIYVLIIKQGMGTMAGWVQTTTLAHRRIRGIIGMVFAESFAGAVNEARIQ